MLFVGQIAVIEVTGDVLVKKGFVYYHTGFVVIDEVLVVKGVTGRVREEIGQREIQYDPKSGQSEEHDEDKTYGLSRDRLFLALDVTDKRDVINDGHYYGYDKSHEDVYTVVIEFVDDHVPVHEKDQSNQRGESQYMEQNELFC